MKRTILLLVAVLALVVSACSSEQASPSAAASAADVASATPEPTPETSAPAEPSEDADPSGSAFAIPSFDLNGDPELAGRFPDSVGGQPLVMQSFRGDAYMGQAEDAEFEAFLTSVGADLEDVSVAVGGIATDPENFMSAIAFRIAGAPEDRLSEEFLGVTEDEVGGLTESNIGGKQAWTAADPSGMTGGVYIYIKDDTIYYLMGTEEQAAEILEALP